MTNNIDRRVSEHNANKNIGTRGKGPWKILYTEQYNSRIEARTREVFLKSGKGRDYLKKLIHSPVAQR